MLRNPSAFNLDEHEAGKKKLKAPQDTVATCAVVCMTGAFS